MSSTPHFQRDSPMLACTPEQLRRVREAYCGRGVAREVVREFVAEGAAAAAAPLWFPPRGGQHNTHYQCRVCQAGLRTLPTMRHQCRRCGREYRGRMYDDAVYKREHRANCRRALAAAWAFAVGGDSGCARFAAEVILGYARRYNKYAYHTFRGDCDPADAVTGGRLFEQTLSEADTFVQAIAPAYDLIRGSGVLSERDHAEIGAGLILPILRNAARNPTPVSNWQSWHNAAMVWGGILAGSDVWVRRGIESRQAGFRYQMAHAVTQDGMWREGSWAYHFYALMALAATARAAAALGIDLWGDPSLESMYRFPFSCELSDGALPGLGNGPRPRFRQRKALLLEAFSVYGDRLPVVAGDLCTTFESVLYGLVPRRGRRLPDTWSGCFPQSNLAILRARGRARLSVAVKLGGSVSGHSHCDHLSFVLVDGKGEFAVDRGSARSQAYRLPVHTDWYCSTLAHNAVVVGGKSHGEGTVEVAWCARSSAASGIMAVRTDADTGVIHRRLIVLLPEYLLVADLLESPRPRRFDWVYHGPGSVVKCSAAITPVDLSRSHRGGKYITGALAGIADGPVAVRFTRDGDPVRLTFDAQPGSKVAVAYGRGADYRAPVPMAMVSRRGRRVLFAAVIETGRRSRAGPRVPATNCEVGAWTVTAGRGRGSARAVVDEDGGVQVTRGGRLLL